jgi:endoglucanase
MRTRASIAAAATILSTVAVTATTTSHAAAPALATSHHRTPAALLRMTQANFGRDDTKRAFLMTKKAVKNERFMLRSNGVTIFKGTVNPQSRGRWNDTYRHVYEIDFSSFRDTCVGGCRLQLAGPVDLTSRKFLLGALPYHEMVADGVQFFHGQRDGTHLGSTGLPRRRSHLHDRSAAVYRLPHFLRPSRSDRIKGGLHRLAGHVNVEGGWFDAGDYLKFTHTAAYAGLLLSAAVRADPNADPLLPVEAQYGVRWLEKMWNQNTRTLYLQVGIGGGNRAGTFRGDHDLWRLPQRDDHDGTARDRYAAAHRPVFRAAPPGQPISPNLAGRVAAAFALAAQNDAGANPARAEQELLRATTVYALADTKSPPHPLVTAAPTEYYPEDSWHDDMALGGAEIALAQQALGHDPASALLESARYIKAYIRHDSGADTFNLYDTAALAEADWVQARNQTHKLHWHLAPIIVIRDLRQQIRIGQRRSEGEPFRAGGRYDEFDVDSHMFGMIATVAMYDKVTGSMAYQAFANAQRDWLFGANPWGTSFMVGIGQRYPHCMQHQIANLAGSRNGREQIDTGAVVNGPNSAKLFRGRLGGRQDGMRRCPKDGRDRYAAFTGHGSRYIDDVRAWQTNEPAIDMTGAAILAGALEEGIS